MIIGKHFKGKERILKLAAKWLQYLMLLLLAIATTAVAAKQFTVNDLSQLFAGQRFTKVKFVQRQFLNFRQKPIVSSGYLIYRAPDYFEQNILKPQARRLIATKGMLTILVNDQIKQQVKITSYPNLYILLTTLKDVLSGRLSRLQVYFNRYLQGNQQSWILTLIPRDGVVGNITRIQLTGSYANTQAMTIRYNNGNFTTLSFSGI